MIKLFTSTDSFAPELIDVVKLFFTDCDITVTSDLSEADISVILTKQDLTVTNTCRYLDFEATNSFCLQLSWSSLEVKRYAKRYAKLSVYNCLKRCFNKSMPWGSLTGIRPTKLAYEVIQNENADFVSVFRDLFDVSNEKIDLVSDILVQQRGLRITDDNSVDVYVGIPFCTSRCSYCSFTSGEIGKLSAYVEPFVSALIDEISKTLLLIKANGYSVRNVYFGGGTPTSLSAEQLSAILSLFNWCKGEFTVESGRPDTIDLQKLQVMRDCGVNRISINPQSFCQSTLDVIGRKHTVQEIFDKFALARNYPFTINMDLIAGLPNENLATFTDSINKAISLAPDNITVHSLALKKGSILKETASHAKNEEEVTAMINYSREKLSSANYHPYYLYRQKYVSANLENVGYCLPNKQCLYNIDIMEETTSIVACGCNAISKRVFSSQNRIERQANPKDVKTYVEHMPEYFAQKTKLFEK